MTIELPEWAMKRAEFGDREKISNPKYRDFVRTIWPERKILRDYTRTHGWKTPWFGFERSFIAKMLEDSSSFEMATRKTGIKIFVPVDEHTIPAEMLAEFDDLYQERDEDGRPCSWDSLVGELREIRRAVEAGVVINVDGRKVRSWGQFYAWAHDRYHGLEDGCDSWIGDDN